MIEAVTLDAAGTILELRRPVGETYAEVARRHGADPDPDLVDRRFRVLFADAPPLSFPDLPMPEVRRRERDWWKRLVLPAMAAGGGVDDFDAFFDELYEIYATAEAWRVFPDVVPALRELRERGLRLAVVSNFDSRLETLLENLGLAARFDAVTVSSLAGSAKPDPAIFELALAALGTPPERTLHVGDTPRDDVEGARSAGLHPVLLVRDAPVPIPGTGRSGTGTVGDPEGGVERSAVSEISDLLELTRLLEDLGEGDGRPVVA